MSTRKPFLPEEWYHCFNRGVDKRKIFLNTSDYDRFLSLLYVSNGTSSVRISNYRDTKLFSILQDKNVDRAEPLVEIGAYALMPNHVHFIIREKQEGGLSLFMQKVFTGYTMYFNKKYERTGALLSGTFKAKHIVDDRYLKQVLPYVLLNPIELSEPKWKSGQGEIARVRRMILDYPYSSLPDFLHIERPQRKIVSQSLESYYEKTPTLDEMIRDAKEYYSQSIPQIQQG